MDVKHTNTAGHQRAPTCNNTEKQRPKQHLAVTEGCSGSRVITLVREEDEGKGKRERESTAAVLKLGGKALGSF